MDCPIPLPIRVHSCSTVMPRCRLILMAKSKDGLAFWCLGLNIRLIWAISTPVALQIALRLMTLMGAGVAGVAGVAEAEGE